MYDLTSMPDTLLSNANPKTRKNMKLGFYTEIMHLAPATLSGSNVCTFATEGCKAVCLNTAGHGGIGLDADGLNVQQAARIRRTRFYRDHRDAFLAMLVRDLRAVERRAARHRRKPAVRLNGTSDIPWERQPLTIDGEAYPNVMRAFPDIKFYDYTKVPIPSRGERDGGTLPRNYSLTFSLSESNMDDALKALELGVNVAVVFRGPRLPRRYLGCWVIDGDRHDLRFRDRQVRVVGLRAKGDAVHDHTSGFVHD
jgi:hypothetical protein